MTKTLMNQLLEEMENVPFDSSLFQIEHMVINKETPERAYRQILLELNVCMGNLQEAEFALRELEIDVAELKDKIENQAISRFDKEKALIQIERKEWGKRAQQKLIKECIQQFEFYYAQKEKLPKITKQDFENAENKYWQLRLTNDAKREMFSQGAVSAATLQSLGQIGIEVQKLSPTHIKFLGKLDNALLPKEDTTIAAIADKMNKLDPYVAVLIPKRHIDEPEVTEWKNLYYPNGMCIKFARAAGNKVEDNRNSLMALAIEANSKYAFFVDTDNKLNTNTIAKFVEYMDKNEDVTMLSAFSFLKDMNIPVPMNIVNGTMKHIEPNQGLVECNWVTGLPAAILRISHVKELMPLFATQRKHEPEGLDGNVGIIVGEDTYLCQKLIEAKLKIMIDTNEIVDHINVNKGE